MFNLCRTEMHLKLFKKLERITRAFSVLPSEDSSACPAPALRNSYDYPMTLERLRALQDALSATTLAGWLIYDFQKLNPLAHTLLELPPSAHLTRRFFFWIPKVGLPTLIHNSIESGTWQALTEGLDLERVACRGHEEMTRALRSLLVPSDVVAMEFSPMGAVPYVSKVDAGTLEWVRSFGVEIVSSANLLQNFLEWSESDLAAHNRAVKVLLEAKDAGFKLLHERLRGGWMVDEFEAQQEILRVINEGGLITDHAPIVAFGAHAADPHYAPASQCIATLERGGCVLIDLWGQEPGHPYADITWMGYAGTPSEEFLHAWEAVKTARDEAVRFLRQSWETFVLEGWMVDRCARNALENAGYGEFFTHRLGHNLGVELHGPGANLDDLETHDTRTLGKGLGFTIEPGVYPMNRGFGIRSEINVFMGEKGPRVTTPNQHNLFVLGDLEWEKVVYDGNA